MEGQEVFWCSSCLVMSTRPRVTFDSDGRCNACVWSTRKRNLDWDSRARELSKLLDKHRKKNGQFDCVVPVSGGKDGTYVFHKLRYEWGMNPLALTIRPELPLELGEENLRNFVSAGPNHILVSPSSTAMRQLNRTGLVEMGFPYYGWLIAILVTTINVARQFDCQLVFYGEDGEVEYGGSNESEDKPVFTLEYLKRIYLESGYEKVLSASGLSEYELAFFRFSDLVQRDPRDLDLTHWSYFENWDPYKNYMLAKNFYGLGESESSNTGTFTNFAQNDQALYALHTYFMYLKFGFGRANQDACIEVRRGAMTRSQAVELVRIFDGQYPAEFHDIYLEYFQMSNKDFQENLKKWANKRLFRVSDNKIEPKFRVE